ncbi:hypothetical protein NG829_16300 [Xanthomonas sacchari]|uniref:hypothetical protein n=1 Tax=Xanthomonas sacchari TaxID=56458 RepID=UPI00225E4DB7|nr:hypothetical protein [Xanthomonas sacchari]UYK79897.1 hypothetical protein NG829_16300 [Xanthomonas sacchari]
MDWKVAISVLVPAMVAMAGWFVVNRMAARKDLATRRRELIVGYLIDAYRKLEKSASAVAPEESWVGIESAIADIQLFGSTRQVHLAQKFAHEMSQDQTSFATTLLEELRHSLRRELELPPAEGPIIHLRFSRHDSHHGP